MQGLPIFSLFLLRLMETNSPDLSSSGIQLALSLGAEEEKLGIKGSSTRQVFFENVKVPAENVLGQIGKGHLIAFNALNTGRFKLCALSNGGAKQCITTGVKYANERHQFKVPIASFWRDQI